MKVFAAQFGILFGLGMIGIAALLLTLIPTIQQQLQTLANTSLPPIWVILVGQAIPLAIILAIAVSIGSACARSLKLRSHLIDRFIFHEASAIPVQQELQWSLGIGLIVAVVALLLDHLLQPYLPPAFRTIAAAKPEPIVTLAGILYGGITEEIMLRWGVMSGLVWLGWKILKRGSALPSQWIYQMAIVFAAVIFGLGHLPATAALAPLTPLLVGRALVLNGIVGVAYGWLFWQYSLEAAIFAHMCFHIVNFVVNRIF
jgi:membrane protease YdiL (CAAX protease family)